MNHNLLTLAEVAQYLDIKPWKIEDMVAMDEIPSLKLGRRRMFLKDEIDKWINRMTENLTPCGGEDEIKNRVQTEHAQDTDKN